MKKRKFVLSFATACGYVIFLSAHSVLAQTLSPQTTKTTIALTLEQNIISETGLAAVTLSTTNEEIYESLKLRPTSNFGQIYIFDEINKVWVSQSDLWSKVPKAAKTAKIKFFNVDDYDMVKFSLLVQNTINGEIAKTNELEIWTNKGYKEYVQKVNQNIDALPSLETIDDAEEEKVYDYAQSNSQSILAAQTINKKWVLTYLAFFISAVGVGFVLPQKTHT